VFSPETFPVGRLYLVLKHSRLYSLLKVSTDLAALFAFRVPLQWALTLVLLISLSHLLHSQNHWDKTLIVEQVFYRDTA
jgi:hypothetical protein